MRIDVWCGSAGIVCGFFSLKLLLAPLFTSVAESAWMLVLSFALLEAAAHMAKRRWRWAIWTIAGLMVLELAFLQWMKSCCMI